MEELQETPKTIIIYLIVSGLFYMFMKGKGFVTIDYGFFFPVLFAVIYISSKAVFWWSRYFMPKVSVNGFNGSILGKPDVVRDSNGTLWAIFNTGEYLEPFHGKGKLATLVIPLSQLQVVGKSYNGSTLVKTTPIRFLPSVVYDHLMHNSEDFNLNHIKFGFYDEYFKHENPKISDFDERIEILHDRINMQKDNIEKRNDELIETMELARNMAGDKIPWYKTLFTRNKEADQQP